MMGVGTETTSQVGEESWVEVAEQVTPSVVLIRSNRGQGSGFLVDANGTIGTNEHVIDDVTQLTVTLASGEVFSTVWIVATDAARDLAILRIAGTQLAACRWETPTPCRLASPWRCSVPRPGLTAARRSACCRGREWTATI